MWNFTVAKVLLASLSFSFLIFRIVGILSNPRKFLDDVRALLYGRPVLNLVTLDAAKEVLEKRGAIYSDRPRMVFINEMIKLTSMTFLPYGEQWRTQRRLMGQYFNSRAVSAFRPAQMYQLKLFLHKLYKSPGNTHRQVSDFTTALIMHITYGYHLKPGDDMMTWLDSPFRVITVVGTPGTTLVDRFPFLKYIPGWCPGGYYERMAQRGRPMLKYTNDMPFQFVKDSIAHGTAEPSLVSKLLHDLTSNQGDNISEAAINHVGGAMYRAGSATTAGSILTFLLAMVLWPDVQRKAREEVDTVIGHDRLPSFDDWESLPYLDAVFKEVMRYIPLRAMSDSWNPPLPSGVPHKLMRPDEYNGQYFPAGTIVVSKIRDILHDAATYDKPEQFIPERYLDDDRKLPHPSEAVFGFGRRICPGRHFAESTAFIAMASLLSLFDILPPVDEQGIEQRVAANFSKGFGSHPMNLSCRIVPRDQQAVSVLQNLPG